MDMLSINLTRKRILVLGGARSGKSQFAQNLARELGGKVLFVATGEAKDEEMEQRITQHRRNRPSSWRTLEAPIRVAERIGQEAGDAEVIILDCLTLLISNLLVYEGDGEIDYYTAEEKMLTEVKQLIDCISKLDAHLIIVSNEVGSGLVPPNKLGRIYRDLLGRANQLLAENATEVYLLVAGIPLKIKPSANS